MCLLMAAIFNQGLTGKNFTRIPEIKVPHP
jgi:hypothetical protein